MRYSTTAPKCATPTTVRPNIEVGYLCQDREVRCEIVTPPQSPLGGYTENINGADGLAFDGKGILWVATNQGDEVVGLNRDGRVIAELGDFLGVRRDGSVRGLLFPASLVIVRKHRAKRIPVTNLALPLTGTVAEPEADVSKYTVSQIDIPDLRRDRRERDHDYDDND